MAITLNQRKERILKDSTQYQNALSREKEALEIYKRHQRITEDLRKNWRMLKDAAISEANNDEIESGLGVLNKLEESKTSQEKKGIDCDEIEIFIRRYRGEPVKSIMRDFHLEAQSIRFKEARGRRRLFWSHRKDKIKS